MPPDFSRLLSRPELLPANDAIRNGILFEAIASHPRSRCRTRCWRSDCGGPGFGKCFNDGIRLWGLCCTSCHPYRRLMEGDEDAS